MTVVHFRLFKLINVNLPWLVGPVRPPDTALARFIGQDVTAADYLRQMCRQYRDPDRRRKQHASPRCRIGLQESSVD